MIEGLHVEVSAEELAALMSAREAVLTQKAEQHEKQAEAIADALEGVARSSVDPKRELRERSQDYRQRAATMAFLRQHLIAGEVYRLEPEVLHRYGLLEQTYRL